MRRFPGTLPPAAESRKRGAIMRHFLMALFGTAALALALPASGQQASGADGPAFAEALIAYKARESIAKHAEAWKAFSSLATAQPSDYAMQIWCARTSFYYAHRLVQAGDKKGCARAAQAGSQCARQAQAIRQGDYDGRYWELMNNYKEGATLSPVGILKAVKPVRGMLEDLTTREPTRFEGHVFLAMAYRELPSVISWGDDKKALEHAQKAEAINPRDPDVLLEMAEALLENGDKESARLYFRKVAESDVPKDLEWETDDARAWARKRLADID